MDNRIALPVSRIYESRRTVPVPGVGNRTPVKPLCRIRKPVLCAGRKCPLDNQTGPFDSMPRCRPVGLKRIIRPILSSIQIGSPVLCKMFRYPPLTVLGPFQHTGDDASGPFPVFLFAGNICRCQKSFHGMHIGVQAAIIIQNCKIRIPCINGKSFFFVPEAKVIKFQSLFQ